MFDFDVTTKTHFTEGQGEYTYKHWCKEMGINAEDFPFKVKTGRLSRSGREINMNVVSWGFYQGSDWNYYVFVSYRSSDQKLTVAYLWDVDENGKTTGTPRKHQWVQ